MFSTGIASFDILRIFPLSITLHRFVLFLTLFLLRSFDDLFCNLFVFGDFNVHYKDWLTYSGGIDKAGKLCYVFFLSQTILPRRLTL